jgi:hypothetical protein
VALNDTLISAITDDQKIKQALFLSPGSNILSSKGSERPQTEYHWLLCQILPIDHPTYQDAFQKVLMCGNVKRAAALWRLWANKIKN